MSRAINTAMAEDQVIVQCKAAGVSISATEVLPDGGTHLVCTTTAGADAMRTKLRKHLIPGPVRRTPFYVSRLG